MNYEEMSDFEINQAVTCEMHQCHDWAMNKDGSFYQCGILGESYSHQEVIDYCNNPSNAWPIIIENRISLTALSAKCCRQWEADAVCTRGLAAPSLSNTNPLRAAMIVFLMMQGEK